MTKMPVEILSYGKNLDPLKKVDHYGLKDFCLSERALCVVICIKITHCAGTMTPLTAIFSYMTGLLRYR